MQDTQFQSLGQVGKIPWNRKWQPTPVFLPGNFHGWRNLAGYSPWDHKTSDTTEMHVCPSLPDSSSFCGGDSLQSDRKQSFFHHSVLPGQKAKADYSGWSLQERFLCLGAICPIRDMAESRRGFFTSWASREGVYSAFPCWKSPCPDICRQFNLGFSHSAEGWTWEILRYLIW